MWVWSGQLVVGLTLIGIGALLLLRNYAGLDIDNWWAVFFLIPAAGSFWAAWAAWRVTRSGYATSGPLTGGLLLLAVALIFLLGLEWGRIWPVFLLILGVGALLPRALGRRERWPPRDDDVVRRA